MNQEEYEERMKDPHYRDLVITKATDGKGYVFISYRSNSWRKVLCDIVYKLQKEYGLRIYFDKDFANESNVWVYKTKKGAFAQLLWDGESKICKVLANSRAAYEAAGFTLFFLPILLAVLFGR